MRRWDWIGVRLAAAGALVLQAGCGRQAGDEARLSVVGSSTIAALMGKIAKLHEARDAGSRVEVQTGGSTRGIVDVRSGLAEVGMVSRALKGDQADLQRLLLARDGLGIIVHRSNPVRSLTREQVELVYRGSIRNWRELGGPDMPIVVIGKCQWSSNNPQSWSSNFPHPSMPRSERWKWKFERPPSRTRVALPRAP